VRAAGAPRSTNATQVRAFLMLEPKLRPPVHEFRVVVGQRAVVALNERNKPRIMQAR
jgi:hypothetical protein